MLKINLATLSIPDSLPPVNKMDFMALHYNDAESFLWLKKWRWGNPCNIRDVVCPCCGKRQEAYFIQTRCQWRCKEANCGHTFSITSGTPFHGIRIHLPKLIRCIYEVIHSKNGVAASEISTRLTISYPTALKLLRRVRFVMFQQMIMQSQLAGEVHIDGYHINPKRRTYKSLDKKATQLCLGNKMVNEKGKLLAMAEYIPYTDTKKGYINRVVIWQIKAESHADIKPVVERFVSSDTTNRIRTDSWASYEYLAKKYPLYASVNHSNPDKRFRYCNEQGVHSNAAETVFSKFSRMQNGVYFKIPPKYRQFYASEAAFRLTENRLSPEEKIDSLMYYCLTLYPNPEPEPISSLPETSKTAITKPNESQSSNDELTCEAA